MKILLALVALACVALVALPWWLGLALRPAARALGAEFARYERDGYTRFRLEQVRLTRDGFVASAGRIEADSPLVWLGRRLRGQEPVVAIHDWQVAGSRRPRTASAPTAGLPGLQSALSRILPRVIFWVPRAAWRDGTVQGYGPTWQIARVAWDRSGVRAEGLALADHSLAATLGFSEDAMALQVIEAAHGVRLDLQLRGTRATGFLTWQGQRADLDATFPANGWQPREAVLRAEDWTLPATTLRLAPAYATVQGSADVVWESGTWRLALQAQAKPAENQTAPSLELQAAARGDLHAMTLETLRVDAPFARARLSAPVTLAFDGPSPDQDARLEVEADLAGLPGAEARGRATGTVVASATSAGARLAYQLAFADIALRDFRLPQARARGAFQWPHLAVDALQVELGPADRLEASGRLDVAARTLSDVSVRAEATPGRLARWLPAGLTWDKAVLAATLEGPLAQPRHAGRLETAGFTAAALQPVSGKAEWRGTGLSVAEATAILRAGGSTLRLRGTGNAGSADLQDVQLTTPDRPDWHLQAPVHLTWSPDWQISPFQIGGPDGWMRLQLATDRDASFVVEASRFESARLRDWIRLPGPAWSVDSLRSAGRVQDARLGFDVALDATVSLEATPAHLHLEAAATAEGLDITALTLVENERVLTQATGRLPLTLRLDPVPRWQAEIAAPLDVSASIGSDSPLWAALAAHAGIALQQPAVELTVRGTLEKPEGRLSVRAETVRRTEPDGSPLPEITGLRLDAELRRDALTVNTFVAQLDGQKAEGSGTLPMDDARWRQLWSEPAQLDWTTATGRLALEDADLAVFARRLPQVLAPQGRISAHLELAPGGRWLGALQLNGGATRPLPPFGTVQDIRADLRLDGTALTIRTLTGRLGGEQVDVSGTLTRGAGDVWEPALALRGRNLPLVRSPGLLLRTDLDLRTEPRSAGPVHVGGTVTVRDCLVLADLAALLPSGTREVTRTPPYFAVPTPPFRDWTLGVELRGDRAVRVRTALFEGTATPRFRLAGTLGEPRAVGQLTVDEGRAVFPFAVFAVQQGAVRLSEADPTTLQISGRATARRHGYDLLLEAGGTPAAPTLTFSSTPALDAADVLMMITTGRPPASDTADLNTPQRLARFGTFLGRGLIQEFGLGGDRLEISTGEEVSRLGRETFRIEYRVNDRWFLTGEYDEYDHYNAGVRWRVHALEGPP